MAIFRQLADAEAREEPVALAMVIASQGSTPRHEGSKMLVFADGRIEGSVGGGELESRVIEEALGALRDGRPRRLHYSLVDPARGDVGVCGGQVEVYVEPVLPRSEVVVIGGGHVGNAVTHLAHWLGFRVVVADDRAEFCTPEANPDADAFVTGPMSELPQKMAITPRSYLVLTTRGSSVDVPGLPALLASPAAYIGVIGSKRRWSVTRKSLLDAGISQEALERVHTPIGIEIQAETPEEIAVSILAEIIQLSNHRPND